LLRDDFKINQHGHPPTIQPGKFSSHFGLPGASPAAMLQGVRSGHQRHGLRGEAGFFGAESHGIPLEKICGYPLVI